MRHTRLDELQGRRRFGVPDLGAFQGRPRALRTGDARDVDFQERRTGGIPKPVIL